MLNFFTSLILASLLLPTGLNFLTSKIIDYSYSIKQESFSPQRIMNNSFGIKTTAKNILIIDDESGAILYSKNPDETVSIASITKLMTALVLLDNNPDWDKNVTFLEEDKREGGIIYLLPGDEITTKDLFNLMLTASANEAAIALARNSGIGDFPSAMNKKAKELGMEDAYFFDPSGIEPDNVSSPSDLLKLAKEAFGRKEITEPLKMQVYEFEIVNTKRKVKAYSTDYLLNSFLNYNDYEISGAKTGYLDEAGYCLLLEVKKVDGPSLTLVLLGAEKIEDRWQEAKGLVDWVFRNYKWENF
jgi:D-alanyl-D-alanine endopeptidase (penicillin-binding protein 7)